MRLEDRFLFIDAQTTGMRPPAGQLIDLGYSLSAINDPMDDLTVTAQRFALPDGQTLPKKVMEITGYGPDDFLLKPAPDAWTEEHFKPWLKEHAPDFAVIHYAQFEIPFLKNILGEELPFQVLCAHQITRRLFPTLPSQNIRAVSGFFGRPVLGPNRADEFVRATAVIWRGLVKELLIRGLHTADEVHQWLKEPVTKKKSKTSYSYRIPPELRLKLPDRPGIYKMLAKTGEVLYVGKATSLKDRVNSYFRGVKGREKRKLEMLAQTWDLKVEECGSPLEAALRETDEIKRLDPRYNVSLKTGQRKVCFYSEDFLSTDEQLTTAHPLGPFRPGHWIDMVIQLHHSLQAEEFSQIFFEPVDPLLLQSGFMLFLQQHGFRLDNFTSVRSLLAYGLHLHRHHIEEEEEEKDAEEEEIERELNAEDLAGKYERLLRRAGGELVRSRQIRQILSSDVEFLYKNEWRKISLPQSVLDIAAYDRASILLGELRRLEHRIVRHPR